MTYCCGIVVRDGLVMIADTRTNAGLDNISIFRKLHVFGVPGQRIMALASSGNLSLSQSVVSTLTEGITNPQTGKPVAPMTLARAFAPELERGATEFHTLVGNFILCAILGKKPAFGDPIKSEQVRMTAAIFYAKTKMGWKETVVNEPANKDDKPFPVDDARQRLIDEVDRIRARKEQEGE